MHTRVLHCDEHQSQISNVRLNCSLPAKHKPLEDVPHSQGVTQSYTFPGGHNYFLFHQLVHHYFVCNFCGTNEKMKLALWVYWLPRWNTEIINKKSEHWTSLNSGLQWKWWAGGCLGLFKCVLVIISTSGIGCIYIHYRSWGEKSPPGWTCLWNKGNISRWKHWPQYCNLSSSYISYVWSELLAFPDGINTPVDKAVYLWCPSLICKVH